MHVAMWPAILLAGVVAALSVLPLPPPATSASYRVALSQAVAQSTVNSSLALFATHAAQAAQAGADFIIFGEFTLFQPANRAQTLAICVKERATVLASTQAMVAQSKLHFAVVNFCDFDTATNKLWNANFVVGPTGVIAVYRKSHVWFTSIFDTPAQPDLVVVKQLGVSFGCFMCYDILFPSPGPALRKQGITHFLYNANIPVVGSAAFRLWSLRFNATLLAADAMNGGAYVRGARVSTSFKNIFVATVAAN